MVAGSTKLTNIVISYIYIYGNGCVYVCVCVCPGITLERLERFQPNLVHILLYIYICV
jgi:hypothetical protein